MLTAHPILTGLPPQLVLEAAREVVHEARVTLEAPQALDAWASRVAQRVQLSLSPALRPVINATGVVLHTNLGRAPWDPRAVEAALEIAGRYCDLEIDPVTGRRGDRLARLERGLTRLTGAEAALAVNNGAAALMLCLGALARGREVVVSRGELVEIGGSFRVPEIIEAGGALLREVGTTNRTHRRDYAEALGPAAGALLRVHPSNFRMSGYTKAVSRDVLVALGGEAGVPVVEDQGSGALVDEGAGVREALAAGVDVVICSADKLLAGPQAGLVLGRRDAVRRLRAHPMYRALRLDKVILAALDASVRAWLSEQPPLATTLLREPDRSRADALCSALRRRGVRAEVRPHDGATGGGAWSEVALPGWAVVVSGDAERLSRQLWQGAPPVRARVHGGAVWLDLRTVMRDELGDLEDAVCSACARG